jgi:hypothetical protein
VDFGVADMGDPREGKRTPINIVMEYGNKDSGEACAWLSLTGAAALVQKAVGDEENSASKELVEAAEEITAAAAKIERTIPTILANRMGSQLANAQAARKAIAAIVEPALKRAGIAAAYARSAIDALKAKSSPKVPTDIVAAMQHQEVRSALLKMSVPERAKAVSTAINSGDESFLAAATSGSPVLSGMSAAEQDAARNRWRADRHPDDAARCAHLSNGVTQLERLTPMLSKWADQLLPEPVREAS